MPPTPAKQPLTIRAITGDQIERYRHDLARLRVTVFREFPYLYDGDLDYEAKYIETYMQAKNAIIVIALAPPPDNTVVGMSTGLPMSCETPEFQKPFIEHGYDINRVFYFGESVLLKNYRGRGAGHQFFDARENHVRQLNHAQQTNDATGNNSDNPFNITTFCAVDRPVDHPRRPANYIPHDRFWTKRGYTRHPELATEFSWKDLDESEPSPKPMTFWLRQWDK